MMTMVASCCLDSHSLSAHHTMQHKDKKGFRSFRSCCLSFTKYACFSHLFCSSCGYWLFVQCKFCKIHSVSLHGVPQSGTWPDLAEGGGPKAKIEGEREYEEIMIEMPLITISLDNELVRGGGGIRSHLKTFETMGVATVPSVRFDDRG